MDKKLQEMLDKQACAEVMMTYCRALDRLDEKLLRSVFHPDSVHNHGFEGPSNDPSRKSSPGKPGDFCTYAMDVLRTFTRTHHHLGNIFVEVKGDVAFTEAYFTAFHRMRAKGTPGASPAAWDTEMDYWVAGRYLDRMERRNGVWKISHRTGLTDWHRIEAPSSQDFENTPAHQRSQRGKVDLVFNRATVYGTQKKMTYKKAGKKAAKK